MNRLNAAIIVPVVACAACGGADALQADAGTRFIRDPARMKATQAKLVDTVRTSDPKAAQQLETAFRGDIVAQVAPAFKPYGFSTDDVVDMTAAYWITAWEAANGKSGTRTDPAAARGVRNQLAGVMRAQVARMDDAAKQDIADTMLLQTLLADARMTQAKAAGSTQLQATSDAIYREAAGMLKTDLRQVEMSARGFTPVAATAAADAGDQPSPSAGNGRTPPISGYYFRAVYGLGAAVSFEPLVFFGNGDYVEIDDTALADLDAAGDKAAAPVRWGRWRKQGATFLLTDSKGRTNDYQLGKGNFFPAFLPAQGPKLSGSYKKTTGGGDYMVGGGTTTLAINTLTFNPDGSFTQGQSAGGIAPNAAIGSRRAAAGRWRLDGSTLELAYSDGRRERRTFLWGASGTPPKPDVDMAFIGGDPFLRED